MGPVNDRVLKLQGSRISTCCFLVSHSVMQYLNSCSKKFTTCGCGQMSAVKHCCIRLLQLKVDNKQAEAVRHNLVKAASLDQNRS